MSRAENVVARAIEVQWNNKEMFELSKALLDSTKNDGLGCCRDSQGKIDLMLRMQSINLMACFSCFICYYAFVWARKNIREEEIRRG